MDITISELIVWLVVGALAGSLAGIVVTRKKAGFGRYVNLGIGLVGALIGGIVFDLFNIDLGLGNLAVTFEDLLSAFIGSLSFMVILWFLKRYQSKKKLHKISTKIKP